MLFILNICLIMIICFITEIPSGIVTVEIETGVEEAKGEELILVIIGCMLPLLQGCRS